MNIMAEAAIICGVCLASECVAALLPVSFPSSVIALVLLALLLFSGLLKPEHIRRASGFLVAHLAFFFLPSCVGVMEHAEAVLRQLAPFLLISFLTTPLVYLLTAWSVQWMIRHTRRKEDRSDG